jgi:FAD binding domain
VTTVAQVQLAINFARSLNLRLSVKNKGHDFNAKNTGAGSLSVWTHHLNDIEYLGSEFVLGSYKGPALKVGAGVEVLQVYEYADNLNLEVVGGIARVSQGLRPQASISV